MNTKMAGLTKNWLEYNIKEKNEYRFGVKITSSNKPTLSPQTHSTFNHNLGKKIDPETEKVP